jgi:hypothetical protein
MKNKWNKYVPVNKKSQLSMINFLHCLHPVVYHDWWYSGHQNSNENKPNELFTLVLFNNVDQNT